MIDVREGLDIHCPFSWFLVFFLAWGKLHLIIIGSSLPTVKVQDLSTAKLARESVPLFYRERTVVYRKEGTTLDLLPKYSGALASTKQGVDKSVCIQGKCGKLLQQLLNTFPVWCEVRLHLRVLENQLSTRVYTVGRRRPLNNFSMWTVLMLIFQILPGPFLQSFSLSLIDAHAHSKAGLLLFVNIIGSLVEGGGRGAEINY